MCKTEESHNKPSEDSPASRTRSVPRLEGGCQLVGGIYPRSRPDYGKSINSSGQRLLQSSLSAWRDMLSSFGCGYFEMSFGTGSQLRKARGDLKGRENKLFRHWALGIEFSVQLCSFKEPFGLSLASIYF